MDHLIDNLEHPYEALFRLAAEIKGTISLDQQNDRSSITLQGSHRKVELSIEQVESSQGFPRERVILVATVVSRVPEEIYKQLLHRVKEAEKEGESPSRSTWLKNEQSGGFIVSKEIVDFYGFGPQSNEITSEMMATMRTFIDNWAWKTGAHIEFPSTQRVGPLEVKFDGTEWRAVRFYSPHKQTLSTSIIPLGSLGQYSQQSDEFEEPIPLQFESFYEAQSLVESNPRLALIGLVTSIETGTKNCIRRIAPETQWLMDEIQSPPVRRLLFEYLPNLVAISGDKSQRSSLLKVIVKDSETKELLNKMVEMRNQLVHGKPVDIKRPRLEEFFVIGHQILWAQEELLGNVYAFERFNDNPRRYHVFDDSELQLREQMIQLLLGK